MDDEITVSPMSIGSFEYMGSTYEIFESLKNSTNKENPREWQFRYKPLIKPEVDENGELNIIINENAASIKFFLYNEQTNIKAYEKVIEINPEFRDKINKGSVIAIIPKVILFNLKYNGDANDIDAAKKEVNLNGDADFCVVFYLSNKNLAAKFKKSIKISEIEYSANLSLKSVQQNIFSVDFQTILKSKLFVNLDGDADDIYIHRNDLRNITELIRNDLIINKIIENSEENESIVFDKLLSLSEKTLDTSNLDDEKWRATYNADDLKPDKITEGLNKIFSKDYQKNTWKYNGEANYGAEAAIPNILSFKNNISASYGDEGLKELLKENDITVEFKGDKIIAKSLLVRRLNVSELKKEGGIKMIASYVNKKQDSINGTIYLGNPKGVKMNHESAMPKGTIIPWIPPESSMIKNLDGEITSITVPNGWSICNGENGKPDLRGLFIKGAANLSEIGKKMGSETIKIPPIQVNSKSAGWNEETRESPNGGPYRNQPWPPGVWHGLNSSGKTAETDIKYSPPCSLVIYLIKD